MKIDLSKFKNFWWEDYDGNKIVVDENLAKAPANAEFYCTCFPCQVTDHIDHYGYHPKGIDKLLIKIPFISSFVKRRIGKTFKPAIEFHTTYSKIDQDCIIAMVNSGDYTLEQAIWIMTHACERCGNVLIYKYSNGADGYPEHSTEWGKAHTECDFCRDTTEATK